jgi:dipeptidase
MCDSIVALGAETALGTTLFAKNSDRKREECQPFVQHEAAHHPPGARTRCTHIEIPQVAETYRVMGHSPWWVWGFEHGVNEHGVALGNHTVFSKESLEERPGLIGMDLVRLGLERGRDAREALEIVAALIERYGQGGAALEPGGGGYHNSFLIADPNQAWVLETSNRRWGARHVQLEACSNRLALGSDWEIASRDLASFARGEGWWRGPRRVDLGAAYRNPHIPACVTAGRQRRAQVRLEASRGRHDVHSFQRMLRDHDPWGEAWTGAHVGPSDERFFTLCAHSDPIHWTTASLVAPLPDPRRGPWPVWIGFGTPCTGIFLPVYLDGILPAALARGPTSGRERDRGAWACFSRLQSIAEQDPPRFTREIREAFLPLESTIEAGRVEIERAARDAAAARDRDRVEALLSQFMTQTVDAVLARAEALTHELG